MPKNHDGYILNMLLADELLTNLAYKVFILKKDPMGEIRALRLTRQQRIIYTHQVLELAEIGVTEQHLQYAVERFREKNEK